MPSQFEAGQPLAKDRHAEESHQYGAELANRRHQGGIAKLQRPEIASHDAPVANRKGQGKVRPASDRCRRLPLAGAKHDARQYQQDH
jgi:hypothetical protein